MAGYRQRHNKRPPKQSYSVLSLVNPPLGQTLRPYSEHCKYVDRNHRFIKT